MSDPVYRAFLRRAAQDAEQINANSDTLDTVLDITSQYTDLVFYQMYARYEKQREILDRWTARVGKPFLNGDSSFSFTSKMMR